MAGPVSGCTWARRAGGSLLIGLAACAGPLETTRGPTLRLSAEPVVGALGELEDVADVGYGFSVTYSHPVQEWTGYTVLVDGQLGLGWNEVGNDTANSVHLGVGGRVEFDVATPSVSPFLCGGISYWYYSADAGDARGPGVYVGAGVDWPLGEQWLFGISGAFHFVQLDGDVNGLGIVPVLGLSVGCRF